MNEEPRAAEQCLEWAISRGAQVHGVSVKNIAGRGNGLIVTSERAARIWIPRELLLTLSNILSFARENADFEALVQEWSERVAMTPRRAIVLLMAYAKRNDTPWSVYLRSLPKSIDSPIFWDGSERQLLGGTSIDGVAEDMIAFLTAWLGYQQSRTEASSFTKSLSLEEIMLYEMLVDSRALLSNEDDACMVPVIDFANHSSIRPPGEGHQNAVWDMDESGFELKVVAGTLVESEVLFSYGKRGNAELLFKYGFTEPSQIEHGSRSVTIEVPLDQETEFLTEFGEPSFRITPEPEAELLQSEDSKFLWIYSLYECDGVDWEKKRFKDGRIDAQTLHETLKNDPDWPVFYFKACTVALACVDNHLQELVESEADESLRQIASQTSEERLLAIDAVRTSEQRTYEINYKRLEALQEQLYEDQVVKKFLASRST